MTSPFFPYICKLSHNHITSFHRVSPSQTMPNVGDHRLTAPRAASTVDIIVGCCVHFHSALTATATTAIGCRASAGTISTRTSSTFVGFSKYNLFSIIVVLIRLRPRRHGANGEHARKPSLLAPKSRCNRYGKSILTIPE